MTQHFCHQCSLNLGLKGTGSTEHMNFTGSSYTLEKFLKHVPPSTYSGSLPVSVFNTPDYDTYKGYMVDTYASGSTMVDSHGRTNHIFYVGKTIGVRLKDGVPVADADTVKLVLAHSEATIHGFPISSDSLKTAVCSTPGCGRMIIEDSL